jgi:hypothetical protein
MRGAQEFAVGHAGEKNVIGKAGLAGDFGAGVHAAAGNADDAQLATVGLRTLRRTIRRIFLIRQVSS